jgi:UrcA family protein
MRSHQLKLLGVACLALPLLVTPALAQDRREVRHSDLDLTQADDAAIMARRLEAAANEVCEREIFVTGSRLPLRSSQAQFEQCRENALKTALEQLNRPQVDRAYAQSRGARTGG